MGVYAHGQLIYGYVHTDKTTDLFSLITSNGNEEEEGYAFEEMHQELQDEHGIALTSVGYGGIDLLYAFSANASGKGFDNESISSEDLMKTEEYAASIKAFLTALDIVPSVDPGWHILSYMN